jgi:hypothetical protein
MDLKHTVLEGIDWINLAQYKDKEHVLENMVIKHQGPYNVTNFSTSWGNNGFMKDSAPLSWFVGWFVS